MASRRRNLDRISTLPDSLLCHILSSLSAKEAVATSIFSKRWRFLWTLLTNLDFDDEELRKSKAIFPKIVYSFLLLRRHDSPIKRLRLKWFCGCQSFDLNSWVRAAIAGQVEELDLQTLDPKPIQVPPSIFCHKALVILKLNAFKALIDVPSSAHLPNLKTLHLQRIQYKDIDSARNLFSACSVLEELTLTYTKSYKGRLVEFPSVCCCVGDSSIRFSNTLVTLRLLAGTILNVPAGGVSFPRLKTLELVQVICKDDDSVRNLLSGCPVLRKLQVERSRSEPCWMLPLQVPNCLVFHLKTFCLLKFQGSVNEMKCVEYILKNSMVLEMVKLNSLELEVGTRLSILQKLAMFKRGSKNCQLQFD